MILHLPYEAQMGGPVQGRWCYSIERCQKVLWTKCKNKCKIEASIAEAYILRRCQTSQQNTMLTTFLACINHPLVTMPMKMNRALAFSVGNSEVQVVTRPWNMKSGALSCYMCWPTYPKWSRTCCKFSTNFFSSSHNSVSNSLVSHWYREFHEQFWRESREPTPQETLTLLREGAGNGMLDFISWFKQKVLSILAHT